MVGCIHLYNNTSSKDCFEIVSKAAYLESWTGQQINQQSLEIQQTDQHWSGLKTGKFWPLHTNMNNIFLPQMSLQC